jgi:U4/U6.U5 tri-snRNP-associated protein 1
MAAEVQTTQGDLTLEETNKVRISLGLKPIGVEAAEGEEPPIDTDAIAEDNYAARRDEMRKAKEKSDLEERIAK